MREWYESRKVLDCVGDSHTVCFGDVTGDATLVLWCWSHVPGICSSRCPCGALTGLVVDHTFGTGRGEWGLSKIVNSEQFVVGGEFGVAAARAHEVQG